MKMMKLGITAILAAGLITPWVVHHYVTTQLKQENRTLRQEVVRLNSAKAELSNQLARIRDKQAHVRNENMELLTLRNELGLLRRKAKQAEVPPAKAPGNEQHGTNAHVAIEFPRENFTYKGFATPEASLESFLTAAQAGDTNAFLECLAPDYKAKIEQEWQGKSETQVLADLAILLREFAGLNFENRETLPDGRIGYTLSTSESTSDDGTQRMIDRTVITFTNIDNQWKLME